MPESEPAPRTVKHLLHRPLDVQEHAEAIRSASATIASETYQDADGQHLWTLKRFYGAPDTNASNPNNPEEVEQVRK
ncbi:hypothetical protein [Paenarthrobacter sp. NPDC089316]|uniref:hypothetical protein n=1 Tax=unclassified Paenarthrobacter TaxID=2634190 RepID=UPI00344333F9